MSYSLFSSFSIIDPHTICQVEKNYTSPCLAYRYQINVKLIDQMRNFLFPKIFFDANTFYPPTVEEKVAIAEIEKIINETEDIMIEIPHSVRDELSKAPKWIQHKITRTIYTIAVNLSAEERKTQSEIRTMLFGNQQNLQINQLNDAIHIFEAKKYGCRYFVTLDKKHILSKFSVLEKHFNLKVITPTECLQIIKKYFQE